MTPRPDIQKVTVTFEVLWNLEQFPEAIRVSADGGRPLALVAEVAYYFESRGMFTEALAEWQYLVDAYFEMGERLLPLLYYPQEVFLLGAWYFSTDKVRSARYLSSYVWAANKWGKFPLFNLPHKAEAQSLLEKVEQ